MPAIKTFVSMTARNSMNTSPLYRTFNMPRMRMWWPGKVQT